MATPTDRLDAEHQRRLRDRETEELLDWARSRATAPAGDTPAAVGPAEPEVTPPTETSEGGDGAGGLRIPPIPGRAGRLLQEGGELIQHGARNLLEASPLGTAQRALAGEPPRSPVAELKQAGAGALQVAAGAGKGLGVVTPIFNQPATEEALVGMGFSEERARAGAEILSSIGAPLSAAAIPAIRAALQAGTLTAEVAREVVGLPKVPTATARAAGEVAAKAAKPVKREPLVTVREADAADAEKVLGAGEPLPIAGKILDINFDRIETGDDVKQVLAKVSQVYRESIAKQRGAARSHEEIRKAAEALGYTVDDLLERRQGQPINVDQAFAARQVMVASATRLRTLADAVHAGDTAAIPGMLDQLGLHAAIQGQVAEIRHQAGLLPHAFAIDATGEVQHLSKLGQVIEQIGTGTTAARLAGMIRSLESPEQIARLARAAAQPTTAKVLGQVYVQILLSGPQTKAINFAAGALTVFEHVLERGLESGVRAAREANPLYAGEPVAMLYGMLQATGDAFRLAGRAARTGQSVTATSRLGTHVNYIRGEAFEQTGAIGKGIDYLGAMLDIVGARGLVVADEFVGTFAERGHLTALAYRSAVDQGLTGKAAAKEMLRILEDPPPSVLDEARQWRLYTMLQSDLQGHLPGILSGVSGLETNPARIGSIKLLPSMPVGKVVLPFWRILVNSGAWIGERTPGLNLFHAGLQDDIAAGGVRRDAALGKIGAGALWSAWIAAKVAQGEITGGGPQDPGVRKVWLQKYQPYSMRLGNTWYSFSRGDPIGGEIGLIADFVELAGQLGEAEAAQLAGGIALAVTKNLGSKAYMQGLADAIDAISDPDGFGKSYLRRLPGGAVPILFSTIERTMDPTRRETRDARSEVLSMLNEIKSRLPTYSTDLPPMLDPFGDPIVPEGSWGPDWLSPIYTKTATEDPVVDELLRLQFRWPAVPRTIGAGLSGTKPIPLSPHEHHTLSLLSAGRDPKGRLTPIRDQLATLMATPLYARQSDAMKAVVVQSVIQGYRDTAEAILTGESKDLQELIGQRIRERARDLSAAPAIRVTP